MHFIDTFIVNVKNTSVLEFAAVVVNLVYVVLMVRSKVIAWLFGCLGSLLFVVLMYQGKYYTDALMNLFYAVLGIIGYIQWKRKVESSKHISFVHPLWKHIVYLLFAIVLSVIVSVLMIAFTDQKSPVLLSSLFSFSVVGTILLLFKKIENWIYFCVIDAIYIWFFVHNDLALSAVLYVIFTLLSVVGYLQWKKEIPLQNAQNL